MFFSKSFRKQVRFLSKQQVSEDILFFNDVGAWKSILSSVCYEHAQSLSYLYYEIAVNYLLYVSSNTGTLLANLLTWSSLKDIWEITGCRFCSLSFLDERTDGWTCSNTNSIPLVVLAVCFTVKKNIHTTFNMKVKTYLYEMFLYFQTMSDILVVLPPLTVDDHVIFAKNSDRPPTEVQEVIYVPAKDHVPGSQLHVSYWCKKWELLSYIHNWVPLSAFPFR